MEEYRSSDNEIKLSAEGFGWSSEGMGRSLESPGSKEYFAASKREYFPDKQEEETEKEVQVEVKEEDEQTKIRRRRRKEQKAKELLARTGYLVASVAAVVMLAGAVPGWEKDFNRGAYNDDTITAMVCDAVDRKGIPALMIFSDSNGSQVMTIRSGSNGAYDINLPEGEYKVEVSASGYLSDEFKFYQASQGKVEQVFALSAELGMGQMRIVLQWGEVPSDLDSHLFGTGRNNTQLHVFYSAMQGRSDINPGREESKLLAMLDVDDTTSYGPETITIYDLNTSYLYSVFDYSSGGNPGSSRLAKSGAVVKVYTYGSDIPRVFELPAQEGTWWNVFKIHNGLIIPVQTITNEPDL